MTTLTMENRPLYGAAELLQKARKYLSMGLLVAACIHFSIIGGYYLALYLQEEEAPVRTIRILKYSELGQPPSISGLNEAIAPSVSVSNPAAKPQIGIPVPVPDAEISPDMVFPTQNELSQVTDTSGMGTGSGVQIETDVKAENIEEGPPPDFVPVNILPQFVKQVKPNYPEIARKARIEGTVWVKIWVTKEGKVKEVVIAKSDNEVFNQVAIDAAKQCVFTPAVSGAGPVAVWVTFPFKFDLHSTR
jgi:protein TonB